MVAAFAMLAASATPAEPPTAVMIHGAGGGGWEYAFWAPEFRRAGYRVVARDLVPAPGGLAVTAFDDYRRQVVGWAGRRRVVLIGASLGGILALKAAESLQPEAIVLVNSVTPLGVGEKRPRDVPDVIPWANGPLKDTEDAMPDSDRRTILWAHRRWRNESGRVVREVSAGIEAPNPKCPVLVVIGERDTDIPPENSRALAHRLRADIHEYAAMSHVGPLLSTRAREVARATLMWLGARRGVR